MDEQASTPGFRELFGGEPDVEASAPGRVNLIGEHTDYNDGYVLPVAIPQRTRLELARRTDGLARVWSADVEAAREPTQYVIGQEVQGRGWLDYVQGLTHVLRGEGLDIPGFDARIVSEVPVGAGLSSSAALEIALGRALRAAFGLDLDDVRLARLGQKAETDFVGAPVGIMDPMASSLAGTESALFLDTRTLVHAIVPLPRAFEIVVIDAGVPHRNAAGGYRARRAECARAAALLGVKTLRALDVADLPRTRTLPEPLFRRVRHVVTENDRVLAAVAALRSADMSTLGALFDASHASMRDDYEVSTAAIDLLVEIARAGPDVEGARLTGGGFGGSVVILARQGAGHATAARVARAYSRRSGFVPRVLVPDLPIQSTE